LEQKKRPAIHQLLVDEVLSGVDVNPILGTVFGTEPLVKRSRTEVSPKKHLNPQPLASAPPRTLSTTKADTIIHIHDDPEPETFPSTFITKHPPSPLPQSPNPVTTNPPQNKTLESMQLDQREIVEKELPETT
jgi:hypothetical protein